MVRIKFVPPTYLLTSKKRVREYLRSGDKTYRVSLSKLAQFGLLPELRAALPAEYDRHSNTANKGMSETFRQLKPDQRLYQWTRTLDSAILAACRSGNEDALRILLNFAGRSKDIIAAETFFIKRYLANAIESESVVCVRFIIDTFLRDKDEEYFIENNFSTLLVAAANVGNANVLKELLCISDGTYKSSLALRTAVKEGHTDCVRLLMDVSIPTDKDSEALREAAFKGFNEIFDILLPVSDPKALRSEALRW